MLQPHQSPDAAPRRIVIATQSLGIGGTERHLTSIAPALVGRGWAVTIYCFNSRGAQADKVAALGVDVVGPPVEADLNRTPRVLRLLYLPLAMFKFGWLLLRTRPAIAHFFLGEPYIAGAPIAIMLGIRTRVMSRRSLNHYLAKIPGAARIERTLHGRMTAVLANSRAILRDLESEGCPRERLGLIYNGVVLGTDKAPAARSEVRRNLGIAADALVAIIVANLNPYKGHADLIAALAGVKHRLPPDWTLLCAGSDLEMQTSLEEQAMQLGIGQHVRFLGLRTDVPDLLAAADIGILCSHEEGFSNALIEKMAAGLAMVVSDVGGNPEAVLHGVSGLVVPSRSPVELGDAIATLASDRALRTRFGTAARQRVRDCFTMGACVDRYDAFYRGVLAGRHAGDIPEVAPDAGADLARSSR